MATTTRVLRYGDGVAERIYEFGDDDVASVRGTYFAEDEATFLSGNTATIEHDLALFVSVGYEEVVGE